MVNLTTEKWQLCDIQGRLFELALKKGYDCPLFIENFMNSQTAAALDVEMAIDDLKEIYRQKHGESNLV